MLIMAGRNLVDIRVILLLLLLTLHCEYEQNIFFSKNTQYTKTLMHMFDDDAGTHNIHVYLIDLHAIV